MAPFFVLVIAAAAFWFVGRAGLAAFQDPSFVLRAALGLMFFLTASAHWGKRRPDLIRMVSPAFPRPDPLVTLTGVLEILGAIGLFVPTVNPLDLNAAVPNTVALRSATVRQAVVPISLLTKPPERSDPDFNLIRVGGAGGPVCAVRATKFSLPIAA